MSAERAVFRAYPDPEGRPEIPVHRHGAGVIPANQKGGRFALEFPYALILFGIGNGVAHQSSAIKPDNAAAFITSIQSPTID